MGHCLLASDIQTAWKERICSLRSVQYKDKSPASKDEHDGYERSAVYTGILSGPNDVVFPRFRSPQVTESSESFSPSSGFASASTSTITDGGKRRNKRWRKTRSRGADGRDGRYICKETGSK